MNELKKQLLITKSDYDTIMACLKGGGSKSTFNPADAAALELELKNATLVGPEELPEDCVRLHSTVTVLDKTANKKMEVTLVTPGQADIRQRKISILSPIGTALIGFRAGEEISWEVPAGKKVFTILSVSQPAAQGAEV